MPDDEEKKEKAREYARRYYANNKEKVKESQKRWRENNREKFNEGQKRWREKNPEKFNESQKRWREKNSEKLNESQKRWREKNPEKWNEMQKRWREKNPEKFNESQKRWREENAEKVNEYSKRYREKNPEKVQEYQKHYREKNPEKIRKNMKKHRDKYGQLPKRPHPTKGRLFRRGDLSEDGTQFFFQYVHSVNELYPEFQAELWLDISKAKHHFIKQTMYSVKKRCKKNQIPYNLDFDYLWQIWPEDGKCPALGVELVVLQDADSGLSRNTHPHTASLDKFYIDKGYVKGNVSWVSMFANTIKTNASTDEVEKVAKWMRDFENNFSLPEEPKQ